MCVRSRYEPSRGLTAQGPPRRPSAMASAAAGAGAAAAVHRRHRSSPVQSLVPLRLPSLGPSQAFACLRSVQSCTDFEYQTPSHHITEARGQVQRGPRSNKRCLRNGLGRGRHGTDSTDSSYNPWLGRGPTASSQFGYMGIPICQWPMDLPLPTAHRAPHKTCFRTCFRMVAPFGPRLHTLPIPHRPRTPPPPPLSSSLPLPHRPPATGPDDRQRIRGGTPGDNPLPRNNTRTRQTRAVPGVTRWAETYSALIANGYESSAR